MSNHADVAESIIRCEGLTLTLAGRVAKSDGLKEARDLLKARLIKELDRAASDRSANLLEALKAAVRIAEEARVEWDAAPAAMKAGKLLIALGGRCPGYRADIDAIHAAIAKAEGKPE